MVADLWDLNDFWYHTVSGWVIGGFAAVHVVLNWRLLVAYAGFRLRRPATRGPRTELRRLTHGHLSGASGLGPFLGTGLPIWA